MQLCQKTQKFGDFFHVALYAILQAWNMLQQFRLCVTPGSVSESQNVSSGL